MDMPSSPPVDRLSEEDSPGIPDPYTGSWDCDPATDDLSIKIAEQGSERVLRAMEGAVGHFQMKAFDLARKNLDEPVLSQYWRIYNTAESLESVYRSYRAKVAAMIALNLPSRIRGLEDTLQEALKGAGFKSESDADAFVRETLQFMFNELEKHHPDFDLGRITLQGLDKHWAERHGSGGDRSEIDNPGSPQPSQQSDALQGQLIEKIKAVWDQMKEENQRIFVASTVGAAEAMASFVKDTPS